MPFTLTLPKLSPTMTEGTIAKWHKEVGDFIEPGDLLLEVSTDKATVEYNAVDEGYLQKVLIGEGDEAAVNQAVAICTVEKGESIEGYQPEGLEEPEAEEAASEEVAEPTKKEKQPASTTGAAFQQPVFAPEPPLENYCFEWPSEELQGRILASPLARRTAKEKELDLTTVKGSGPKGRIVEKDLEKAQPLAAVAFGRRELPQETPGEYEEQALSPMRKAIAKRLQEAKTFMPHFYVSLDVDVEEVLACREQLKNSEVKVTVNDFIVRACALALRQHPVINSSLNTANNTIVQYKTIDVAIAVSVDGGLITPIVRHADYKNLGQLSIEVKNLAKRARDGKLEPHEYRGGSFTVSNLGMFGVNQFQAILNPPQAAIIAIGGVQDVPVVKDGEIVPGKRMTINLSVDHRVIDGVAAAQFLQTVKKLLESPAVLLI